MVLSLISPGFSDITFEHQQTALQRLLAVLTTHLRLSLEEAECPTIFRLFRRNYKRSLNSGQSFWPACQADVMPYGLEASIKNLCSWSDTYSNMLLLRLVGVMYHFVAQHAFPALLVRTIVPDAFLPIMSSAVYEWETRFGVIPASDSATSKDFSASYGSSLSSRRWTNA